MPSSEFREALLSVLDQKNHWGWQYIVGGKLSKSQLLHHFQQEYEVYVRDFPIMLARVLGRMPPGAVQLRREFAENIYEEQTGGLSQKISKGLSHPELFLKMMGGLGYRNQDFENIQLVPTSLGYRTFLDLVSFTYDWRIAAAVLTLFVEGSIEDRERLKKNYHPTKSIEAKLKEHSLHRHYGISLSDMDLVRAHHSIEGGHRKTAWETLLKAIPVEFQIPVVRAMQEALELWLLFRDGVCLEMSLEYPKPTK